ncbi:efflux RND transporter periplasmic adaptor subunit [Agrobacterium vitis]|uniref:Efflux RND transporter periplasmic adaptor subunit n=3 Tax=Agrobacterium vitis TaxID=373 RepID=A0A1S2DJX1_AGRVI|nr:efflux RND transporter periplasmic adaptor subunit [Agrobacterium vitis]MCM2468194.1 efflux RND transporter periplasmic adaptor subunit [Agrobacterium vitis]MUO70342.1 efflux RND transporter periplasmic adaptor subunit [Agrobacterium vitis]MUO82467.1 efflux RND transporter periplasmic adaptor subunit [Agrobacterium vitis]MVA34731.1 efflux RND transporter periplasmic adaptor subunit [Agrobacterium vitis]
MKRMTKIVLVGLVVVGAGLVYAARQPQFAAVTGGWLGKPQGDRQRGRDMAIPVVAAPVIQADVPVYVTGVGSVKPLNTVVIQPQVSGRITKIGFQEGQDLKKGDLIATLDDALYKAQLDEAIGKKAQDSAQLTYAILEMERLQRLIGNSATTQQQLDNQVALVAQYRAQVQSDQAAIEAAQAQLDYTVIKAPMDGRTGIRNVDVGNIVSTGDTTGIVTLSQIKPITILFSIPQQDLARVNISNASGALSVDALGDDGKTVVANGTLTVVDNQVDTTTGTVRLRAEFPNDDLRLWPGAFVNARLLVETKKDVLTVPSSAIQRGPAGTYAYIVQPDQTVKIQAVTVEMQDDQTAVIAKGVSAGETVVTTGFARLQDGAPVRVSTPQEADPANMAVPLDDNKPRQRHGGNRNNGQARPNAHDPASRKEGAEKPPAGPDGKPAPTAGDQNGTGAPATPPADAAK